MQSFILLYADELYLNKIFLQAHNYQDKLLATTPRYLRLTVAGFAFITCVMQCAAP